MLIFLTPEGAPNYRKLMISPKQVALVANGVMGDLFYLEITPMYFFCLIWFFTSQSTIFQLHWDGSSWGPQGFWGSGENGYLFSGSWGALVIISGDLGSKLLFFGDLGSPAKKQKNKGKASNLFEFLKISSPSSPQTPPSKCCFYSILY